MPGAGSKLYWKGSGSTALMETDSNDRTPTTYIFFNGARIARIDPGTTTAKYYVTDNIGSTEVETDDQGQVARSKAVRSRRESGEAAPRSSRSLR